MVVIKEGFKYRRREWDLRSYMLIQKIDGHKAHCQYVSDQGPGFKETYIVEGFGKGWVIYIDWEDELNAL